MQNLLTTTELARKLKTTRDVILARARKCLPNKTIERYKVTYWNEEEVTSLLNSFNGENKSNNRSVELTKQLENTKTQLMINQQFNNTIEEIKRYSKDDKLKIGLTAFQSLLEDLQQENNELKDWKAEKLYIENEKYKSKELRAKINRLIRQVAVDRFDGDYGDTWNYYFNVYSKIHCFKNSQNINMIEDRGDLKEFYNLILNN